MRTTTIPKNTIDKKNGVVILPLKEYERLRSQAVPTYYLSGKTAQDLDMLVEKGLHDYQTAQTKKIRALSDLD